MKEDSNKGDTMNFAYVIQTQNLEEYGENFHKFKGGSAYVVHGTVSHEIYEEDAYGPGEHSYYEVPSITEASVAAEVMKHVNMHNGLRGSFDYITQIETMPSVDANALLYNQDFNGTFEELIAERVDSVKEQAYHDEANNV